MSLLISLLIILLIAVVFGFISSKKVKDRLQLLSRAATTFSQGNLRYRLPVEGEDEISDLTSGWNAMAERVEEQVNALQRLSEENASLAEQSAQGAALEERQRLARELHDSISQQLFAMNMTAAAVVKQIESSDVPYKLKQQIGYLEEMAASIQSEMRTLIFHLRPIQLEGQTLVQGVRNLLRDLEERHDLPSDFLVTDEELTLPGWENHLFRLIQEAISNVLKHAKASRVHVSIMKKSNRLFVTIEDDGVGFDFHAHKRHDSYGLNTMKERAEEIGGVLDLFSEPNKGTRVRVYIPLTVDL